MWASLLIFGTAVHSIEQIEGAAIMFTHILTLIVQEAHEVRFQSGATGNLVRFAYSAS